MHAMQYQITLPADYNMNIIRKRVAENGHQLDQFPGLGLKAYLIRERGVNGSPVNQYAPFYLWASLTGMTNFLWDGGGFAGIVSSFGRPVVQNWTGVVAHRQSAYGRQPKWATRQVTLLAPDSDPEPLVEELRAEAIHRAADSGVHLIAYGIDPRHWELMRFTLWFETPPTGDESYELLHVCQPHIDDVITKETSAG